MYLSFDCSRFDRSIDFLCDFTMWIEEEIIRFQKLLILLVFIRDKDNIDIDKYLKRINLLIDEIWVNNYDFLRNEDIN